VDGIFVPIHFDPDEDHFFPELLSSHTATTPPPPCSPLQSLEETTRPEDLLPVWTLETLRDYFPIAQHQPPCTQLFSLSPSHDERVETDMLAGQGMVLTSISIITSHFLVSIYVPYTCLLR
jgi:hypothetical protein